MTPRRDDRHQRQVDQVLAKIRYAQGDKQRIENKLRRVVADARSQGATWTEVGQALGITQQGAQKRYGDSEERDTAERLRVAQGALKRARKRAAVSEPPASNTGVIGQDTPHDDPAGSWPDGTVQGTID